MNMKQFSPNNIAVSSRIRSRGKNVVSSTKSIPHTHNDLNERPFSTKEPAKKSSNKIARCQLQLIKCTSSVNKRHQLLIFLILSNLMVVFVIRYAFSSSKTVNGSIQMIESSLFLSLKQNHIHPRTCVYAFDKTGYAAFSRLGTYLHKFDHKPKEPYSNDIKTRGLKNSKKYRRNFDGPFVTNDCVQLHDWQLSSFPTCNNLHDADLLQISTGKVKLINGGFWRNVWTQKEFNQKDKVVIKTLRFMHDYTHRNYERHRRDAVAMERLTKSPNVLNIFGYCGNSGLFEYGNHGDVESAIFPKNGYESRLSKLDLIRIAIQVCMAIVDVHTLEKDPSIAHTDISPAQFIYIDGFYKLNDFNRCRFLRRNVTSDGICGFKVGNNPGKLRSPEEYNYEIENEKVDVFSMGHIFYMLLTRKKPFADIEQVDVYKNVRKGELPGLDEKMKKSEDLVHVALKKAMDMCYAYKPEHRASAKEILDYLVSQYDVIDRVAKINQS